LIVYFDLSPKNRLKDLPKILENSEKSKSQQSYRSKKAKINNRTAIKANKIKID